MIATPDEGVRGCHLLVNRHRHDRGSPKKNARVKFGTCDEHHVLRFHRALSPSCMGRFRRPSGKSASTRNQPGGTAGARGDHLQSSVDALAHLGHVGDARHEPPAGAEISFSNSTARSCESHDEFYSKWRFSNIVNQTHSDIEYLAKSGITWNRSTDVTFSHMI